MRLWQALSRLKRMSSALQHSTPGASPRLQGDSSAAQPDHFAVALEKLRRERGAGQRAAKQPGGMHNNAGARHPANAAGECLSTPESFYVNQDCISCACVIYTPRQRPLERSRAILSASRRGRCLLWPAHVCSFLQQCASQGKLSVRVCMAGGANQESPGQQRRARWDPMADTEDRLALERLTQRAAALSAHPSPAKVLQSADVL